MRIGQSLFFFGFSARDGYMLREVRRLCPTVFTILFSDELSRNASVRLCAFKAGARMVSDNILSVQEALRRVASLGRGGGELICPTCGSEGLTENELHLHHPLFHSCEANGCERCPICGVTEYLQCFAVHLHNEHGPPEGREPPPAPFAAFAWAVCRRPDGRFLMVNEPAGISRGAPRYWLPAGRVDIGESLLVAAQRETLEEAGVTVRIIGVLRFMVRWATGTVRIIFLVEPEFPDAMPKSIPDWESVGALWVEAAEAQALDVDDFRSPDPAELFPAVASGELMPQSVDTDAFRSFDVHHTMHAWRGAAAGRGIAVMLGSA